MKIIAAETIRGINVVIGAETTALSSALSDVTRRSKDIQGELRQVDRLLRLDPTNTDLVAQRQQLLTNAVANTRERLDALRAAQEQVNQQFARGEISEGQYRAFQREVIQAEQELRRFEDRLTNINRPADQLANSLNDISQRSRGLQNELRQVDRLLQLDPSNVELVAQRQEILNRAISTSQERLNALRGAQERVNEQFRRGEISEAQYRAFQRDVAAAEQELRRFENQLNDTGGESESLGNRLRTSFSGAVDSLKGMVNPATIAAGAVAAIGVALVGVATAGLSTALQFEEANRRMAAATGLPIEAMEQFEAQAENMYGAGRGEVEEIYEAMTKVQQAFHGSAEATGELTNKALILKKTFDYEVNESIRAVDSMVKNFGIDGNAAFDIITKTAQLAGDKADDLLDTFNEYSPQFASMGLSAETFAGILVKGAQEGAFNLDKVADAVKEFNIRAQDGSKGTAEGFAAIGLNAEEMGAKIATGGQEAENAFLATVAALAAMEDPMAQNQAGVALFGTQWEDVRGKVVTAMADGKTALGDFAGATDEAGKKLDSGFGPTMDRVKKQLGLVMASVADELIPVLQEMAEWIEEHMPEIESGVKTTFAVIGTIIDATTIPIRAFIKLLQGDFSGAVKTVTEYGKRTFERFGIDVSGVWNNLTSGTNSAMSNLQSTVRSKLDSTWSYIKSIPSQANQWGRQIIQSLASGIKSIKIPTPHFDFSVSYKTIAGAKFPVPDLDVRWYKTGGIFNSPTIAGIGDVPEAVLPLDKLTPMLTDALMKAINNVAPNSGFGGMGGVLVTGNTFYVRDDSDITQISRELWNLSQNASRAAGRR